ncbi:hypothetical protein ACFRQM_04335 [Streptomyces sp. NPDC056831]|uniref:hypothetical protein n=1 Tax=Streptomyces sp. NPDC056831 TaxID=3345954 RepID=UPI003678BCD6
MSGDVIPRDQAFRNASAVRDRILDRIARDRAAGRLTAEAESRIRLAELRYARRHPQRTNRAAA